MDPDSTMSDADKIRAKRLAKLGGQNGGPSSATPPAPQQNGSAQTSAQPSSTSMPQPIEPQTNKPETQSLARENPFSQLTSQTEPTKKPVQITITPRSASPAQKERDGSQRPRPKVADRAPEDLETWTDRNLRQILRVTLNEKEIRDSHGNRLVFIASTVEDLPEGQLRLQDFEQAVTEAAGHAPGGKTFEYILQCFKRVSRGIRGGRWTGDDDPKLLALHEARRLCMSYAAFAVNMPEMFSENVPDGNPLVQHLLADPECDIGICTDFLTEASKRFDDEDGGSIKETIVGAAEELSRQLAQKDMLADYQSYVRGLRNLLRFTKIVDAITQSPMFAPPDIEAQNIESQTLLGPFFNLSPMQQTVASNYFSSPKTRDRNFIASAQNAVRLTLRNHQDELFNIVNIIVKTGPASRNRLLDWFALCVNKNHKKRAMQVDRKVVSSDGFMVNVTIALDQLCNPFMDATFSKIDKIDVDYLRRNPRVDISDETKINVDQKASDEFYSHKAEGTSNFISEIFFLTVAAHHYGTEAAQTRMTGLRKSVKRYEKDVEAMETERHKYINNPRALEQFEKIVRGHKTKIDEIWSTIHATHGVLLDDKNQSLSMQLMRYLIVWLLRIASRQNVPKEQLRLPLPEEQLDVFKCLPEYFLEDVVENFKFITSNIPQIITPQQCEELVQICVTFLRSSEYVKNPGVKSGLVTILFYGVSPYGNQSRGVLGDILIGSPFANKHLLHALMKFYIEAENTGTHTQFFDKFNIRFEIFQVIKRIWINTLYRENLAKEASVNTDFFVRFVNMLVNDITFVLDEVLSSFAKIRELTTELADPNIMREYNDEQKKEKEDLLEDHKGRAKSYMQLTKETMETLILFTETLAEAFTMKEIVTRLADMLDYNLDLLTDVNLRRKIKVDDPGSYGFDAKLLVADLMSVYTNLGERQNFIEAIAKDERSYKPANFLEAENIMSRFVLKSPEELQKWRNLGQKVEENKKLIQEEEEELGEIPDEFMDPLMATLMTDPVILPSSKQTIDRAVIRSYLLSDPKDPFNRVPLKIEEVLPNTELKQQIDAWRAEKRAERVGSKMDTSEG